MSATLDQILKRGVTRGARYLPFSEPPFLGPYILRPTRDAWVVANRFSPLAVATLSNLALRSVRPRTTNYLYEDRRTWHPEGRFRYPISKTEAVTRITDRPESLYDPYREYGYPRTPHGEPLKLVPSKIDPSGWTYIPDRPGVLEKARLSKGYAFANPWKVIICLKRKMRREIMHALGLTGKKFKKPRWTQFSYVRCF